MARPPSSYPEDIQETFEYCVGCETLVVSLDQHTCPTEGSSDSMSAADRRAAAAKDERPDDDRVVYPEGRSQNGAWAYHETDEDGEPIHELNHKAGATTGSREEAIRLGCYPCGHCTLIQSRRGDDDE